MRSRKTWFTSRCFSLRAFGSFGLPISRKNRTPITGRKTNIKIQAIADDGFRFDAT